MIPAGLLGALSLTFAGIWPAALGGALVQLQLLLDCSDGEVARWRKQFSPIGVYLDQLAHYSTEAAIPAALGVRADGGWDSIGGWTALGLLVSVLILFLKSETHLVQYALGRSDRQPRPRPNRTTAAAAAPRLLPAIRPFQAVEASLLALAAAVVDSFADGLDGTPDSRRRARRRRRGRGRRSPGRDPRVRPPQVKERSCRATNLDAMNLQERPL